MTCCPNCGYRHADQDYAPSLGSVNMPNREREVILRLSQAQGGWVSKSTLIDFLYGDEDDGGPTAANRCIESHVSKARSKIKLHGWTIGMERFRGYRLVPMKRTRMEAAE